MNTPIHEAVSQQSTATPVSGKRFAVVLAAWSLSGLGLGASLILLGASAARDGASSPWTVLFAVLPLLAWTALAVMSWAWLKARRCHWLWPLVGMISGLASAVFFLALFVFYAAALPLAVYLSWWHLRREPPHH